MFCALLAAGLIGLAPHATPVPTAPVSSLPGFHLVAATARVDYFAMSDSKARVDDARKVERQLEEIEKRLGRRGPERLSYYRVTYTADMERLTGRPWLGITDQQGRRIISSVAVHVHELVHAVAVQFGDPGRFFHEGLAVALAGDEGTSGKRLERSAREGLAQRPVSRYWSDFDTLASPDAYAVAGSFVQHLVARYGLPRVLEFFRGCETCPRDEMFARTFGVTMADAAASWSAQVRQ